MMATQINPSPQNPFFIDRLISPSLSTALVAGWQVLLSLASLWIGYSIASQDDFFNLGDIPKYFVTILIVGFALFCAVSTVFLLQKDGRGRVMAMSANYVGAVLAFAYLLHLWNFFTGMDSTVAQIYDNRVWLWGMAGAYGVFWLSGRLREDHPFQKWFDAVGLGVAMLSLIGLLLSGNVLEAIWNALSTYENSITWLVTLAIIIFMAVAFRMMLLARHFNETPNQRAAWQGWLFLSPNIIGFMLFFAGPLLFSLYLSFTASPPKQTPEFIGFGNYADLLDVEFVMQDNVNEAAQRAMTPGYTMVQSFNFGNERLVIGAKDAPFWFGMKNTLLFAMLVVPLSTIPALFIAIILDSKLPGMKVFRSIYFLPSVAAVVGVGVIWREAMYGSVVGYLNFIISESVGGINGLLGTSIADPNIVWLQDQKLWSMVIMAAWQIVGFNTVLYLAGLQGIPRTLYEAARVDGANQWAQFRHVTFPLLGPTTFFVIITTLINGLQVFNEPYVLFSDVPGNDGLTSVFYLHRATFTGASRGIADGNSTIDFGYAASVAWMIFILIFIITLVQFRVQRSNPYED